MKARPAIVLIVLLFTAGCMSSSLQAPIVPPRGILFTYYKAPLTIKFKEARTDRKKGTSTAHYIYVPNIGVDFGFGEADIKQAAEEAGLTTLEYADYQYLSILNIYRSVKIILYGDTAPP